MRRAIVGVGIAVLLMACTSAGDPGTPTPAPSSGSTAAASPAAPPTPPTAEPLPSEPELRHTVELRRSLGLRADLAYIEAVARDPRATTMYLAIPLLPEEEADVAARYEDANAVAVIVKEYAAAHAGEFAGVYIDMESGAGFVTLWTDHLADHEAAIRAKLGPSSRVAFREVRFSERYLQVVQGQVVADREWMASIPAAMQSADVDTIRNVAVLSVSSAHPRAVELIEAHFDLGEAFEVVSDGTGVALIPWGEVVGRVRTAAGDTPGPADYYLRWRTSDARRCGVGDVGYGLAEDGSFTIPCQAGTWTIEVTIPHGDGWRAIGEGTVDVPANGTAKLDIILTEMP